MLHLFRLGPHADLAVLVDFHMDYIRPTADRTILDILLALSRRQVEWHHDLLATGITDVGRFVPHLLMVLKWPLARMIH